MLADTSGLRRAPSGHRCQSAHAGLLFDPWPGRWAQIGISIEHSVLFTSAKAMGFRPTFLKQGPHLNRPRVHTARGTQGFPLTPVSQPEAGALSQNRNGAVLQPRRCFTAAADGEGQLALVAGPS